MPSVWNEHSIRYGPVTAFNYARVVTTNATQFSRFCVLTRFPHYVVTWKLRRDIPRGLARIQRKRPRRLRKILNYPSGVAWTLICVQCATGAGGIGIIFENRWHGLRRVHHFCNSKALSFMEKKIFLEYIILSQTIEKHTHTHISRWIMNNINVRTMCKYLKSKLLRSALFAFAMINLFAHTVQLSLN